MKHDLIPEVTRPQTQPDGREVITNAFNGETFVFPRQGSGTTAIDVMLEEGGSGGGDALLHIHPLANETFHVREGRLKLVVGDREVLVETGQNFTVPRGIPHAFRNVAIGRTVATVTFDPPQDQVSFFRNFALMTQQEPGWFSATGKPSLLLIALVLHTYRDHMYLAGPPVWLQRRLFAVLSVLARWRGYRVIVAPGDDGAAHKPHLRGLGSV
jgi:mannose-6-phosphate isomerase-like protein (cupin superfamily)